MITKEKGELKIVCEDCGQEEYGGCEEDFFKFWESKKEQGWQARKVGDTWEHYCPTCISQ